MEQSSKPNIIYILGDDHRAESLGLAGYPMIQTPHIDQLAKEGVLFKNFSAPARSALPAALVIIWGNGNGRTV
ncbi:MAG TPA: hypothetical protein DC049_02085 [Spirochaetia bacterium]|nr:hypothetical protein [Spirochaetia bacterium]